MCIRDSYVPINVHPNPYGIQNDQSNLAPPPSSSHEPFVNNMVDETKMRPAPPQTQYMTEEQMLELQTMAHQRLPSRDIPMNQSSITQDEEATPNYIKKKVHFEDYVNEHNEFTKKKYDDYEKSKDQERLWDTIMSELQVPILIGLLYFIFQMPIIHTYLFKKLSFLAIYKEDGNFNFYGLLLKSMMFGAVYYSCIKGIHMLISI